MSSCSFKLGMPDVDEFNRILSAKWDWFHESVVVVREWTTWAECNGHTFSSMPLRLVFPELDNDL